MLARTAQCAAQRVFRDGGRKTQRLRWSMAFLLMLVPAMSTADPVANFEALYGELLARYWHAPVKIHGIDTTVFDYAAMARDTQQPDSLFARSLAALRRVDVTQLGEDNAAKAFWINAYNLGAMRLVVDHYPVDSITSFKISLVKYPWSKRPVEIGDTRYSLREIEKDILIPRYHDVRILFAVSCAAASCPDRTPEAFTAARLDQQLNDIVKAFLANPTKGARLDKDAKTLTLSWIFSKDGELFTTLGHGVLAFVLPYFGADDRQWLAEHTVELHYLDHDWTLNDLAQAD